MNYNQAYTSAISDISLDKTLTKLSSSPNDILATSYIKEIKKQKANINYIIVKRTDNGYNNTSPNSKFLSASSILKYHNKNEDIKDYLPNYSYQALLSSPHFNNDKYYSIIQKSLLLSKIKDLRKIYEMKEGLEYNLTNNAKESTDFNSFIKKVQSKRYRRRSRGSEKGR